MTDSANNLIARARSLAICVHRGQTEWGGNPFIDHPARVAKLVAAAGMGPEAVAAAWLHDGVEDTSLTLRETAELCGERVAGTVAVLSRPDGVTYGAFIELVVPHLDGSVIKLADVVDHLDPARRIGLSNEFVARAVSLKPRYTRALDVLVIAVANALSRGLLPGEVAGLLEVAQRWRNAV